MLVIALLPKMYLRETDFRLYFVKRLTPTWIEGKAIKEAVKTFNHLTPVLYWLK